MSEAQGSQFTSADRRAAITDIASGRNREHIDSLEGFKIAGKMYEFISALSDPNSSLIRNMNSFSMSPINEPEFIQATKDRLHAAAKTIDHDHEPDLPLNFKQLIAQREVYGLTNTDMLAIQEFITLTREAERSSNRTELANKDKFGLLNHQGLMHEINRAVQIKVLAAAEAETPTHQRRSGQIETPILATEDGVAMMLDFDLLKPINDSYGHQMGDLALQWYADAIINSIRDTDIAVRYAGDENLILLPGTTIEEVKVIHERFKQKMAEFKSKHSDLPEDFPDITVSVGAARYLAKDLMNLSNPEDSLEIFTKKLGSFVSQADQALYRAKELGRNRMEIF